MADPLKFLADTKASPRRGETAKLMADFKKSDEENVHNDDVPGIS